MAPPSNGATTARPSARANSNSSGLHSVGIGGFLCLVVSSLSQKNFRSVRAPMHLTLVRDAGYSLSIHCCLVEVRRTSVSAWLFEAQGWRDRRIGRIAGKDMRAKR